MGVLCHQQLAGARAFYDEHRAKGESHDQALRVLSNRLVGILEGCLRSRSLYDEHKALGAPHQRCRRRHIPKRRRVSTRTRSSPGQEIAPALLHESFDSRARAEPEAESTAYVVCQSLGLDSSD